MEEYLDLVDKNDTVIGTIARAEMVRRDVKNVRVVVAFIRRKDGALWIPRRTAHKQMFPLALDSSMGGYVASGESYEEAFARELREELNIECDAVSWHVKGTLTPAQGVHAFTQVYELLSEHVPHYNSEDFCEWFWLTPHELLARVARGEKTKSDLPVIVRALYT